MRGKFVIRQTKKGFHFKLLASNGKTIATSDAYPTRRNCLLGIESARRAAPDATVLDMATPASPPKAKPASANGTTRSGRKPATKAAPAPATANGKRRVKAVVASPPAKAPRAPRKATAR